MPPRVDGAEAGGPVRRGPVFFVLSKVFWSLAAPSNLFVVLVLLGVVLALFGLRGTGLALAALGGLGLLGFGLLPLGNLLMLPLEQRFPAFAEDARPVDGIIVLGGAILPETSTRRGQLVVNSAGERLIAMADLARRFPQAQLVFSGGGGNVFEDEIAEADVLARHAAVLGLEPGRVQFENRSRTTAENASRTRELLGPRQGERWLLVTSAWHMPRAIGCFRAVGLPVEAYPVDYRTGGWSDARTLNSYSHAGLALADLAAKEWAGLLVYRLSGRTSALFPGPETSSTGAAMR